ncbi:hypothetical protein EON80_14685 [bacterium]|nr:MAG: hypothetical protein EON80_14685 [bacterium]
MSTSQLSRKLAIGLALGCLIAAGNASAKPRKSLPKRPVAQNKKPLQTTAQKLRGKVLFFQDSSLWSIGTNCRGLQRLLPKVIQVDRRFKNVPVALSPDGKRLVFSRQPHDIDTYVGDDLFSIGLDGSGERRLTDTKFSFYAQSPRFSPDGKYIVYSRSTGYRMGGPSFTDIEIHVMRADGSEDRRLVGDLNNSSENHLYPVWSRDGSSILFTHTDNCIDYAGEGTVNYEKRIVDFDGQNERPFAGELAELSEELDFEKRQALAANIAGEPSVSDVFRSKDGLQAVFEVRRTVMTKGVGENVEEVWWRGSSGAPVRLSGGLECSLVGWLPST